MPSAKYSCSGSREKLVSGSTAIDRIRFERVRLRVAATAALAVEVGKVSRRRSTASSFADW
jgi:hypothetical protein